MRIEGTDATNTAFTRVQDSSADSRDVKVEIKENRNPSQLAGALVDRNISQLKDSEKKDLPISDKVVLEAIQKANKAILGANRKFEFSIHEKTKEIMIKVVNTDTNEVIREIPPEKILDMVAKMWEMAGIMVDERR